MTTEEAYKYISRIESAIRYNTPIKALACVLHIARQIRMAERVEYMEYLGDEKDLIARLFYQEESEEAEMKKQEAQDKILKTIAGRKIIEEMAKEKAELEGKK